MKTSNITATPGSVPESDSEAPSTVPVTDARSVPESVSVTTTAGYRGLARLGTHGVTYLANGTELWSMELIKNIETTGWFSVTGEPLPVGKVLPAIVNKVTKWEEYNYLINSMNMYGQQVPIRVFKSAISNSRLRDGINRIAIADYLGWDSMVIATGIMEKSMWLQWDVSEEGKKFHELKARRLGLRV